MTYFILILGSFLAAVISGAAGFGGSLLLLPVAAACLGTENAVPTLTVAQLIGNLARAVSGWREIRWDAVGWFCLTALPLAALGAFGFSVLPKGTVTRCVGLALILLVIFQVKKLLVLRGDRRTLLVGGAVTGGLSGLVGSGGPIGAAVFLSLDLSPVAYVASEAVTAAAMHILKSLIYAKIAGMTPSLLFTGLAMGAAMTAGTLVSHRLIRNMEKGRFQRLVALLLCLVGGYMLLFGG